MTTDRQKSAVHFCEEWLHISFEGNIDNRQEVNEFLSNYLDDAKIVQEILEREYYALLWGVIKYVKTK